MDLEEHGLAVRHRGDDTVWLVRPIEVRTTGAAVGGGAVGRLPDGRAVFVDDALPGERIAVELVEDRARYARGRVVELWEPASGRVEPSCPAVAEGCGGCELLHARAALQRLMMCQGVSVFIYLLARV